LDLMLSAADPSLLNFLRPIVGGVVGGLVFLGAIIALILLRKKRSRSRYDDEDYDEGYGTVRRSRSVDRGEK
jgi:hypothetical protein